MNRRQLIAFSAAAFAARVGFADPQAQAQESDAHLPSKDVYLPDKLLLKDWRPRSIYKIPVTEIARARYPIIDAHNHGFNSADQARKIVETMDETGVERAVVFAGTGRPESFAQARAIYSAYPQRFDLWCLFDLRGVNNPGFGPGAVQALEECHRMGAPCRPRFARVPSRRPRPEFRKPPIPALKITPHDIRKNFSLDIRAK